MSLLEKKCVPCESGTPPLSPEKIKVFLEEVPSWEIKEGHVYKQFKFRNFKESMNFINKVAEIAEKEGHHPDIKISYNKVAIELFTHSIKGLSENDFIVAAKISRIPSQT